MRSGWGCFRITKFLKVKSPHKRKITCFKICTWVWATTSGPAPKEVGAGISRWGHTGTHSMPETGVVEKGSAGPRPSHVSCPDAASLSAQAPAAAPCSLPPVGPPSGAAYPRCCCVSLSYRPRTASAPLTTTLSWQHAGCDRRGGKRAMLCGNHVPWVRRGHVILQFKWDKVCSHI